jgi:Leu/Phe-tRNA-protein transferase
VGYNYLGLVNYYEVAQTKTYTKARSLSRSLMQAGFTIRVNGNFARAMEMARDYVRISKSKDKPVTETASRYKDGRIFNALMGLYKEGIAFSVELYDPSGKMVAGSINLKIGNYILGDTVFSTEGGISYENPNIILNSRTEKDKNGNPKRVKVTSKLVQLDENDLYLVTDVAFMDEMARRGIYLLGTGMTSHYSIDIGAVEWPRAQALALIANLPQKEKALPQLLNPFDYFNEKDLSDLAADSDKKGITPAQFVGGFMSQNAYAIESAKLKGLYPAELKIYVLPAPTVSMEQEGSFKAVRAAQVQAIKILSAKIDPKTYLKNAFVYFDSKMVSGKTDPKAVLSAMTADNSGAQFIENLFDSTIGGPKLTFLKAANLKVVLSPNLDTDNLSVGHHRRGHHAPYQ